jgi:hypothetical protein
MEYTLASLVSSRCLAKDDDEELPTMAEAFIALAMSRLMVKCLAH